MKINQKILPKDLPKEVQKLFKIFGSEIRLVGGCVRDLILQKPIKDFDFASVLKPQETIKVLKQNNITAIATGLKYGTVTAVLNGKNFEITTLRIDKNQQGRACDVEFTDDFKADAARRDFTINAIYIDYLGKIHDYFDGIKHLKQQKLIFIGPANQRIEEDFLRILRFFRFSLEYSNKIDKEALNACILQKENLKKLSKERIRSEFIKIFQTKNHKKLIKILQLMQKSEILSEIFAEKLQLNRLQRLLKIEENASLELKFLTAFLTKKSQINNFCQEICATNFERKFFNFVFANSGKKIDRDFLNILLAFNENNKNFVINFYLFFCVKKPKQKANFLNYLKNFNLPNFPINAKNAQDLGLKNAEIGKFLDKMRKKWAKNNFKINWIKNWN